MTTREQRTLTAAAFDAGWDAKEAFDRGARADLVDMLTTHRHGKDKQACDYCAAYYGDIVDRVLAQLRTRATEGTNDARSSK